jgi:hypothetical protein
MSCRYAWIMNPILIFNLELLVLGGGEGRRGSWSEAVDRGFGFVIPLPIRVSRDTMLHTA